MALTESIVKEAAERFGTPLYLYDFDALEERVEALQAAAGPRFTLAYAVKANPSLAVLSFLEGRGLFADVASAGELEAARRAGFPPHKLVSTGPSKCDRDLEALVREGILQIHVEGSDELQVLDSIAAREKKIVTAGLRINPPWGIAEKRTIIGGPGAKKFGFDLESAALELESRDELGHVVIEGFQVFNASNVLDAGLLSENAEHVVELAAELSERFDVFVATIDFGGGLGVPYSDDESPLDLAALSAGLARVARRVASHARLAEARLIFEPGRFLVAPVGLYVTKVLGTKRCMGMNYALVDGGIHHMVRPVLLGTPHRARVVGDPGRERVPVAIAGPLCTSLDVLHPETLLPEPRRGDLIAFENAGAYGYTESMPLFLSHEWAAEVGYRQGRLESLRRPPRVSEILDAQRMPFD